VYFGTLCEDVMIGPEHRGNEVAICIPGEGTATAAYVPDPRIVLREVP
jgi:hypothetical protein